MGCCQQPRTSSPKRPDVKHRREDVLLRIPGASVFLTGDGEAVELAKGDLSILRITDEGVPLATVVKVGTNLQWPLTKDEPVIKLDEVHYLFTLPDNDGSFLNYGVTFAAGSNYLDNLDLLLEENACLSTPSKTTNYSRAPSSSNSYEVYWKDYAPKIDDYNNVLVKAIAGGTGEIVKGIFICSNAYASQVQKGASLIKAPTRGSNNGMPDEKDIGDKQDEPNKKHGGINQSIRRVRKLSEMTEKMSESLLNGVIFVTGSATAPLLQSKAGKAFFGMLPGEVLLASLDAVGKVLDAVEVAERKTLAATGGAVAGAMSKNCRAGPDTGQPGRSSMAHEPGLATTQERLPSMRLQQQAMPLGQLGMYSKLGKPSNPLLQCHQRLLRMH
ncbi:senescence/dehydration-associated protein-like isoform X1, chloroplastic [Iris pallida]|uniref:Senescence/dehydration-associated protein-like isoform X1, chloroplastic n=2 Tax=Iris pallida TaxID=29817 RepID=A0AAX6HQE7_IRIPA|nr:senescence/dehydration-associated protein-like isoform X1, chloroplastic [Iris pallida]